MYDLAIVGGGWAGLTAATAGAQAGLSVCLIEQKRHLGGRTSSFWDARFGCWLDNGPHLFIGAYSSALHALKIWGSQSAVDFSSGRGL
ncbi:MAG: FAD-dependent oxidoreductase, partial [Calditrichota bacterium]